MQYIVSWATIITAVGFFFNYLERTIKDEPRKRFANWLVSFPETNISSRFQSIVNLFLQLFKSIYRPWKDTLSQSIWVGIITGLFTMLLVYAVTRMLDYPPFKSESFLYFTLTYVLYASISHYCYNKNMTLFYLAIFILGGFVVILHLAIDINFFRFARYLGIVSTCLCVLFLAKVFGNKKFVISPVKALISSGIAILLVSLLVPQISMQLFFSLIPEKPILFSYIGLNFLADTLSLVETYLILKLISKRKIFVMTILLLVDILLTALIFSVIVLILGELSVLQSAILFTGPKSWLGIFFWSTFFTSIVFYLFTISAISLLIFYQSTIGIKKMSYFVKIQEAPFQSIGLIAMFFITIGFFIHWIIY